MSKAYVRQVSPDAQESPLMLAGDWPDDLIVRGNKNFEENTVEAYDILESSYEDAWWHVSAIVDDDITYYNKVSDVLMDFIPPMHKACYTEYEEHEWVKLLRELDWNFNDDSLVAQALTLMTGMQWTDSCICGCCQGDWNNIIYVEDNWSDEALAEFEAEYFNTGYEWEVHEGDDVPVCGDDVSGSYLYTVDDDEETLKEILGVDEVVIFKPHYVSGWYY